MTNRVGELGPVQGVEVEMTDAAGVKLTAELGGDGGGDELAGGGEIVQALEQPVHPVGDRRAALAGELARLGDVGDGEDTGHDLGLNAPRRRLVAEPAPTFWREDELRDRPVGTGVER